jgi:quinol monooxygenase YgiN
MLILAGYFDMAPEDREVFLQDRQAAIALSLTEPGCIEYCFSADSSDPGRVRLFEMWESPEDLAVHLEVRAADTAPRTPVNVLARVTERYEVVVSGPLRS